MERDPHRLIVIALFLVISSHPGVSFFWNKNATTTPEPNRYDDNDRYNPNPDPSDYHWTTQPESFKPRENNPYPNHREETPSEYEHFTPPSREGPPYHAYPIKGDLNKLHNSHQDPRWTDAVDWHGPRTREPYPRLGQPHPPDSVSSGSNDRSVYTQPTHQGNDISRHGGPYGGPINNPVRSNTYSHWRDWPSDSNTPSNNQGQWQRHNSGEASMKPSYRPTQDQAFHSQPPPPDYSNRKVVQGAEDGSGEEFAVSKQHGRNFRQDDRNNPDFIDRGPAGQRQGHSSSDKDSFTRELSQLSGQVPGIPTYVAPVPTIDISDIQSRLDMRHKATEEATKAPTPLVCVTGKPTEVASVQITEINENSPSKSVMPPSEVERKEPLKEAEVSEYKSGSEMSESAVAGLVCGIFAVVILVVVILTLRIVIARTAKAKRRSEESENDNFEELGSYSKSSTGYPPYYS